MIKGIFSAAVLFGAACLTAQATTSSYTFTQGGWTDNSGHVGTLTGTFTGRTEANGEILMPDLTSFQADFHETVNGQPNTFVFNLANSTDFAFNPADGSLSFADGSLASGIQICSGVTTGPVCFGLVPSTGAATRDVGFFEDLPNFGPLTTLQGATVSSLASATPEPQSVGLIVMAGGLLLALGCARRQRCKLAA